MGGSIRIPVHFCGVSGLMPSPYRVIILEGMTYLLLYKDIIVKPFLERILLKEEMDPLETQ